ncbi:MAG TPA: glycoside hydrolase family 30 beta sandwich domain-containing protein [Candidatus Acidoferrales bacterium]|nr:glycoside hydrolase family 30 beta sandwich domain-containing protein [Candidatus Acidoferrales bacterium]
MDNRREGHKGSARKSAKQASQDALGSKIAAARGDGTSRRDFLGISALGMAATLLPETVRAAASMPEELRAAAVTPAERFAPRSDLSAWVTSGDQRFASGPAIQWAAAQPRSDAEQIILNPELKFQEVLGFGGALTDATCWTFNRLRQSERDELFHEMFHPSEMGLNVCRICVGASDYSRTVYSFDEGAPDPGLTRFSIDHDREYIIPILRQARQANPDLFLFSSPWSPPGWMKFNNSMLGGSMRKFYFASYARYYLKFLQGYAEAGVPVQALTSQNEVDTDQDGKMPACLWGQEYEISFVRDHLGPLLTKEGVPTKIWMLDHNYNLWGRVVDSLEDEGLRRYCNAVAWHGYAGTPDMMSRVKAAFPEVEMYWTEGGPDYTDPEYLTDWWKWGMTFTDVMRNWCRSITSWNLALDERGKPNVGPFSCGGVVTVDSQTRKITRSGQFWAFAHYSRLVRRGARQFDSQSDVQQRSSSAAGMTDFVRHVAFQNPDGRYALILTNPGPERVVEIQLGSQAAKVPLKEKSLTTLAWS